MKNTIAAIIIATSLISCGSNSSTNTTNPVDSTASQKDSSAVVAPVSDSTTVTVDSTAK